MSAGRKTKSDMDLNNLRLMLTFFCHFAATNKKYRSKSRTDLNRPGSTPLPLREGLGEGDRLKPKLTKYAKKLRKNATQAEKLLWGKLRSRQIAGVKFRRQQPVEKYIADFVSFEKRIIIELDGGQHANQKDIDNQRDRFFSENGYTVLRFWNHDVFLKLEAVLETIRRACMR